MHSWGELGIIRYRRATDQLPLLRGQEQKQGPVRDPCTQHHPGGGQSTWATALARPTNPSPTLTPLKEPARRPRGACKGTCYLFSLLPAVARVPAKPCLKCLCDLINFYWFKRLRTQVSITLCDTPDGMPLGSFAQERVQVPPGPPNAASRGPWVTSDHQNPLFQHHHLVSLPSSPWRPQDSHSGNALLLPFILFPLLIALSTSPLSLSSPSERADYRITPLSLWDHAPLKEAFHKCLLARVILYCIHFTFSFAPGRKYIQLLFWSLY